jgi:adenylate kinase
VRERLFKPDAMNGFVLDGFPRTVPQARALDEIMTERDRGPLIVIEVVVPEAELVKRLSTRRICGSCGANAAPLDGAATADTCTRCGGVFVQRTDDNVDVVKKRLGIYHREKQPLVEYYRGRPTFRLVNGAQSPQQVARDLDSAIDAAALVEPQL